jgi:hypothetical protein
MEAAEESQLTELQQRRPGRAQNWRLPLAVAAPLAAGLALRIWMLRKLFEVNGDSLVYGSLAKNLLLHGLFGLSLPSGEMYPTLIRLPGYPLFLAACFKLFGMENYFAAACVQVAMDLTSCLLLAGFVRRIVPSAQRQTAALATLWLAALCPFVASYAALPIAETPTIFMIALAMWAMARFRELPGWGSALWFTFAVTYATLLRPDGALAALAFGPALLIGVARRDGRSRISARKLICMTAVCVLLALTPFAVWATRNWQVFQVFEPLAPRLATDPGESTNPGWERWVKSWCLDFVSTYEIYWNVPWDKLDVTKLPSRAFDSPSQRDETIALASDYNNHGYELTPDIDSRFERLAEKRIEAYPMRYYVWMPLGRVTDMWLRPRVENLPIDLDWWVYKHHHKETEFSWAYAALNAAYLLLGLAGLCFRPRCWGALLAYMLLRSALLWTIEAPEARYTLECFPMLFALGGVAIPKLSGRLYLAKAKASDGKG